MATHTASHHDKDTDHLSAADRAEQERTANADAQRRSQPLSAKLRPVDTFEALKKHQEEVEEDEKNRTKAFEDSPRFKRIEQRQKTASESAKGKGKQGKEGSEELSEAEAKETRAITPPEVQDDGTVALPKGAALPPAVPEPRNPMARAWDIPLLEPAE